MEEFILVKQKELQRKLEEYQKICDERIEYEKLSRFCEDFLGWKNGEKTGNEKKLGTLTALQNDVFTKAEVSRDGPIAIRLIDDLFVEMPVPKAMEYANKKIKFLKIMESRTRSECHYFQAQLNILILGMEKTLLQK
uniref:Uncharacterized protein n=1 Tax=Panagrolaimus sp. JU765 TaxID=591449 RepID=A0AC34QZX4_9BILA